MKRFILKTIVFILTFVCSFIAVFTIDYFWVGNQYTNEYCASLIDKMERLNSIDSPKIILIGNSNIAFGIDSELIEKEIGMPVVNMGLHGGLSNVFHEEMAKVNTNQGDIVVIVHSSYYDDDKITDTMLTMTTLEKNFELWKLIRAEDVIPILRVYPRYLCSCIERLVKEKTEPSIPYSRDSFNEYGDIVFRGENTYIFDEKSVSIPQYNEICINRLNELNKYISKQGASMVIASYPIGYGEFTPEEKYFIEFENGLRENLDCEVISHFTDYFIPYDMFYDTQLHLNDKGVKIRTEQLIEDIKNWMINN